MTPSTAASSTTVTRELIFQEDGSHKFWKIALNGSSHTVNFGRVGTNGQEQTKDFPDEAAAKKSFDKLVAEKLKKGYTDPAASTANAAIAAPDASAAEPASDSPASTPPATKKAGRKKTSKFADQQTSSATVAAASVAAVVACRDPWIDPPDEHILRSFGSVVRRPLGEPRPFDRKECIAKIGGSHAYAWEYYQRLGSIEIPLAMSREEAHFWFLAATRPWVQTTSAEFYRELLAWDCSGRLERAVAIEAMHRCHYELQTLLPHTLRVLLSIEGLVESLVAEAESRAQKNHGAVARHLLDSFRLNVVPHLDDEELERARAVIRRGWDPHKTPSDVNRDYPVEYHFAAALGMSAELSAVVETWPDAAYRPTNRYYFYTAQKPQPLLLALDDAERINHHWRRVGALLETPDVAEGLLMKLGFAAIDLIADAAAAAPSKVECQGYLEVLAKAHSAETAAQMLRCRLDGKASQVAREWLDAHVDFAAYGLAPVAAGTGRLAEAAIDHLRTLVKLGHRPLVEAAVARLESPAAIEKVSREVLERGARELSPLDDATTPDWLREALAAAPRGRPRKLPSWAEAAVLPALAIGDRRLSDEQAAATIQALAATPVGERHPLLVALKKNLERHVRDEFAWKLFQAWLQDGSPSKEKWAMGALGHLGDDGCALKLAPLVRVWPGESQHQRAVFGLECLRAIGTSAALMQLSSIAQKLKFKALQARAEQCVQEIATEMGLTRDELEDRVVPDCGLDEHGRRVFDFGPRSFSFALGPALKPMLRDADGKLRDDLPKPNAKDDAQLAAASVADWKLLKKQIREVAQTQAGRLERAMVVGRRWKRADFEALIVKHPLMRHLAKTLIWGAFDESGKRIATFRLTDEGDFADPNDDATSLADAAAVGVLHPLELDEAERSAWGQVLGDYEIVAPFPQLGRPIHTLSESEAEADDFVAMHGMKLVAPTLVFTLEKLGWERGMALDGGAFQDHSKVFPTAGVQGVVVYEGSVGMGYIDPNETLTIEHVWIVPANEKSDWWSWSKTPKLKLGDVSPIVISEVLADLHLLKSKSK